MELPSAASSRNPSAARRPASPESTLTTCSSAPPTSLVIFVLFPLVIWTGLALSPAFTAAASLVRQSFSAAARSARTLHFFISGLLLLFLLVHVTMIVFAGFRTRMRAMITGRVVEPRPARRRTDRR